MTTGRLAYQEYLKSEHWKALRSDALWRDKGLCRKCGNGKWVEVHHLKYRTPWTDGVIEDVVSLCPDCHREEHGDKAPMFGIKPTPKPIRRIRRKRFKRGKQTRLTRK